MSFVDTKFFASVIEFLACFWPLFLFQTMLMFWILTLNLGESFEADWKHDLVKGLNQVVLAILADWPWVLGYLALSLLNELFNSVSGIPNLFFLAAGTGFLAELFFFRIQWQIVKQLLLSQGTKSAEQLESFKTVWFRLLIVSFIASLLIISSSLMFLVPGIVIAVYIALSGVICCLKEKGIFVSIVESFQVVNKKFLPVCNYLLPASLLVALLPVAISVYYLNYTYNLPDYTLEHPFFYWGPSFLLGFGTTVSIALWELVTVPLLFRVYFLLKKSSNPTDS